MVSLTVEEMNTQLQMQVNALNASLNSLQQSFDAQLESTYGLDEPMWKQYILYMENLMHGDLGISYKKNVSVNTLIARGFPYTLSIGLLSIAVSAFRAGSAWLVR